MSADGSTPKANRVHIAFFGLRNAGKSTLVNAFCNQPLAIVSDTPGTTTDPVSKAMEILPLGPCVVTDTAGLDDEGELGQLRVARTLAVLDTTDIAVWVATDGAASAGREREWRARFRDECVRRAITVIDYRRGEPVEELRRRVAAVKVAEEPGLLDGLVADVARVVLVCPIDESAPKGRLILPQVQVLRECLDRHLFAAVVQPAELERALTDGATLVITDAQAYGAVRQTLARRAANDCRLVSFSELFARQKGDFAEYRRGLEAVAKLRDGDRVLVAEGCTHHRQCNDIGTVRIPAALERLSGAKLAFTFASGGDFPLTSDFALAVQCGGCMLTRRAVQSRIAAARAAGVPIVNYGMVLGAVNTH